MSFYGLVLVLVVLMAAIYLGAISNEAVSLKAISSTYAEVAHFIRASIV